jgi:hypothetical protein
MDEFHSRLSTFHSQWMSFIYQCLAYHWWIKFINKKCNSIIIILISSILDEIQPYSISMLHEPIHKTVQFSSILDETKHKSYLILIHIRWKLSTNIHFSIYNGYFKIFLRSSIGFLGNFHSMIELHIFPCYQSNLIWILFCKFHIFVNFHVFEDGYNLCLGLCCYKFGMTSSPLKGFCSW